MNSETISHADVVTGLESLFALNEREKLGCSFFEMTTFLAFDYFRKQNVDVAVIETGLGGKWDATNIISPLLSIITSISREHTELLGEDVESIASEKAGILKKGVPLILGPKARLQSIYNRAQQLGCDIFASKTISAFYDEENSAVAELALENLPFTLTEKSKAIGLAIRPPCRYERIGNVIFDVAHNPEAVFSLLQALCALSPKEKFRFLVGFSKDKDYGQCLELISGIATHLHLVQARFPRSATVEDLSNKVSRPFTPHTSVEEGVKAAYGLAQSRGETLVICGSFYIMAEAKRTIFPSGFSSV